MIILQLIWWLQIKNNKWDTPLKWGVKAFLVTDSEDWLPSNFIMPQVLMILRWTMMIRNIREIHSPANTWVIRYIWQSRNKPPLRVQKRRILMCGILLPQPRTEWNQPLPTISGSSPRKTLIHKDRQELWAQLVPPLPNNRCQTMGQAWFLT